MFSFSNTNLALGLMWVGLYLVDSSAANVIELAASRRLDSASTAADVDRCDIISDHASGNFNCTLDKYCEAETNESGLNDIGITACSSLGSLPSAFQLDLVIKEICIMQGNRQISEYDETIFDASTDYCYTQAWSWTFVPSQREDEYCVTYTRPFTDTFCQTLKWDQNKCTSGNYCDCTASSINAIDCASCNYCGSNVFAFDCSNEDPSLEYQCDAIDETTMRFPELVRLFFAGAAPPQQSKLDSTINIPTPSPNGTNSGGSTLWKPLGGLGTSFLLSLVGATLLLSM